MSTSRRSRRPPRRGAGATAAPCCAGIAGWMRTTIAAIRSVFFMRASYINERARHAPVRARPDAVRFETRERWRDAPDASGAAREKISFGRSRSSDWQHRRFDRTGSGAIVDLPSHLPSEFRSECASRRISARRRGRRACEVSLVARAPLGRSNRTRRHIALDAVRVAPRPPFDVVGQSCESPRSNARSERRLAALAPRRLARHIIGRACCRC